MNLEPMSNQSVVNRVFKRISESIINGEIKPGDKLPTETELCEKLGIARNSVREAIKMLSAMGVVEIRRAAGTFVSTKVNSNFINPLIFSMIIEPKADDDLYELRIMFENMVLLILIEKINEEEIEKLKCFMDDVKKKFQSGVHEIEYYVQKDMEFHQMTMRLTHNTLVERLGETIYSLFPAYMRKLIKQEYGIERTIKNHSKIISVLESKERDKVFEVIADTLEEWKDLKL